MLQRDSLKNRYSPGRPGSRRHQRWMNDQALREDLTDEDLRQLYAIDWRSALSGLAALLHDAHPASIVLTPSAVHAPDASPPCMLTLRTPCGPGMAELFEGEGKMQQWQDFCAAPEEEQRAMLMRASKPGSHQRQQRPLLPQERFNRIDRRVKALLKV